MRDYDALARYLRDNRQTAFAWGTFDCCLFAANCVRVLSGIDPAANYRGRYKTALGAARALRKAGHQDLAAAITAACGAPISIPTAGRGDIVLLDVGGQHQAGVVWGGAVLAPGDAGLVALPLHRAIAAWRAP